MSAKKSESPKPDHSPRQLVQLRIALQETDPVVWRRVVVPMDFTLEALSVVIHLAMGWEGLRLHGFRVGDRVFGGADCFSDAGAPGMEDEATVRLSNVIRGAGERLTYDYDVVDNWTHLISVERIFAAESGESYPCCTGGGRACPPEDCGGPEEFDAMLSALESPETPEHEQVVEELGYEFDPEEFDIEAANDRLKDLW